MVLVGSIVIWCVLVYSVRVAIFGNPLANLLLKNDSEVLKNAELAAQSGPAGMNTQDMIVLRRFSRLTMLELVMFLCEVGILVWLILTNTLLWVAGTLLVKDFAALVVSVIYTRRFRRDSGMLTAFRELPDWLHLADRISAGISAAGFLYLFLALNQVFGLGAAN